jgi:hypothetical protein
VASALKEKESIPETEKKAERPKWYEESTRARMTSSTGTFR